MNTCAAGLAMLVTQGPASAEEIPGQLFDHLGKRAWLEMVFKINDDRAASITYKPKWDFLADSVRQRLELGAARTWGDRNQYAWSFAAEVPLTSQSFKFKLTSGFNGYF